MQKSKTLTNKEDFKNFRLLFDLIREIQKHSISNKKIPVSLTVPSKTPKADFNLYTAETAIHKIMPELTEESAQSKNYAEDDHLQNKSKSVQKLFKAFKEAILNLNSEIKMVPKKTYIAFKGKTNIVDIEIQTASIKLWINLKKGKLNDSMGVMRDVSILKGHNGNGDYELIVSDDTNLGYIIGLIKQAI